MKAYLHFWLLLVVICIAQANVSAQLSDRMPMPRVDVRAAFKVFEGNMINVYSSKIDGTDRKLVISEESDTPNALARDAIRATISPAGDKIAYMVRARTGWSPIYVTNSDGQNKRKVLDKAMDFHWTPDGKHILFTLLSPRRPVGVGMSFWADGHDWYILDLETGKSELVASAGDKFHYLASWIDPTVAVFGSNSLSSSWLFAYDLKTRKKVRSTEIAAAISTNGSRTRTVGIVSSGIHEFTTSLRKKRRLVSCKNYQCGNIMWNGDDEIVYNKSTGPKGRINLSETGESGYYILFSIYKYNHMSRMESPVVKSTGKEVYRLQGILGDRAIIVSNESLARTPKYILESRDFSGKVLDTLFAGDKDVWFVGWLR